MTDRQTVLVPVKMGFQFPVLRKDLTVFSVSSAKALDAFIPSHPGGSLIHQALGTDASLLFHAHHTSDLSSVLAKYCVGYMKPWHSEAGFPSFHQGH